MRGARGGGGGGVPTHGVGGGGEGGFKKVREVGSLLGFP